MSAWQTSHDLNHTLSSLLIIEGEFLIKRHYLPSELQTFLLQFLHLLFYFNFNFQASKRRLQVSDKEEPIKRSADLNIDDCFSGFHSWDKSPAETTSNKRKTCKLIELNESSMVSGQLKIQIIIGLLSNLNSDSIEPTQYSIIYSVLNVLFNIGHHHHRHNHLTVRFLPQLIMGMDGCFSTAQPTNL